MIEKLYALVTDEIHPDNLDSSNFPEKKNFYQSKGRTSRQLSR